MKRVILAALALATSVGALHAQGDNAYSIRSEAQGMLMNRDIMSIAEMRNLSQSSFQYGTARSMAMAGAMTSLGADASSMMINPAGLGMYRSGEISFTPMITLQRGRTNGASPYLDDKHNDIAISNFSAIFKLYESGRSRLISLNMGIGYNKISDLNYQYSFRAMDQMGSIADIFSEQLTNAGVELDELDGNNNPNWNSMPTDLWSASLGYKTGLTDYMGDSSSGSPLWGATWLSPDAAVDQYMAVDSYGSIGEYDFSMGANIDNVLYLGATFGVQSIYQQLDLMYAEEYYNNQMEGNYLDYSKFNQTTITSGVGLNLKLGATYRPTEALRIGMAYHTPTWYNLDREYQATIGSNSMYEGEETFLTEDSQILQDLYDDSWRFNSPQRIMVGGSYMINNRAIVTLDYQRDWYGRNTTRSLPYGVSAQLYDGARQAYNSVNTLRAGLEYKVTPQFAIRGGYGVTSTLLNDDFTAENSGLLDIPVANRVEHFAVGLGYAPSRGVSFDLTYMRQGTEYSNTALFYGLNSYAQSNSFQTTIFQNNIALSLVLKM